MKIQALGSKVKQQVTFFYFLRCLTIKNLPQEHKYDKENLPKIQADKTHWKKIRKNPQEKE